MKQDLKRVSRFINSNKDLVGSLPWGIHPKDRLPVFNEGKLMRTKQEVDRYYKALDYVLTLPHKLTEDSIKQINAIVTDGDGSYKTINNDVVVRGFDGVTKVPVKWTSVENTEREVKELVKWYNETQGDPLLAISTFTFNFLQVHAFPDGNGRTSRILIVYLLLNAGYKFIQYAPFEHCVEFHKYWYNNSFISDYSRPNVRGTEKSDYHKFLMTTYQVLINKMKAETMEINKTGAVQAEGAERA